MTCATGKKHYVGDTTDCYDACPTNNYYDNSNVCTGKFQQLLACDSTCLTCNGSNSNQCLSCQSPRLFKTSSKECITSCGTNKYYDVGAQDCDDCHAVCDGCTGPNNNECIACAAGKVMISSGLCGDNCNANQYNNGGICVGMHV